MKQFDAKTEAEVRRLLKLAEGRGWGSSEAMYLLDVLPQLLAQIDYLRQFEPKQISLLGETKR